jgi:hypothetical protein
VSYGVARLVRYSLLAWLGMTFGRHIVTIWQHELDGWSSAILWTFGSLLVLGVGYSVWKVKRGQRIRAEEGAPVEDVA